MLGDSSTKNMLYVHVFILMLSEAVKKRARIELAKIAKMYSIQ